jgi:hypothetical protein
MWRTCMIRLKTTFHRTLGIWHGCNLEARGLLAIRRHRYVRLHDRKNGEARDLALKLG